MVPSVPPSASRDLRRALLRAGSAFPALAAAAAVHAGGRAAMPWTPDAPTRAWIDAHPVVRYALMLEARPYASIDEGGLRGFVATLLDDAASLTGLRFERIPTTTFGEVPALLASGAIDLVPMIGVTDERRARMRFTQPFVHVPLVMFVRRGAPTDLGPEAPGGWRIGVPQGYEGFVTLRHPDTRVVAFDRGGGGVEGLLDGRYDAVVAPDFVTRHWLRVQRNGSVAQRRILPVRVPFAMACTHAATPLASILDAVIARIPASEREALERPDLPMTADAPSPVKPGWLGAGTTAATLALAGCAAMALRRARTREEDDTWKGF